jgi:5-methylcytosine-specific restriction endonuclease McrA
MTKQRKVRVVRAKPVLSMEEIRRRVAGEPPQPVPWQRVPRPGYCGLCGEPTKAMTGFCNRTAECRRAADRKYRELRPEVKRRAAKRWRDNHPEEARASVRRYRQKEGRPCRVADCPNPAQPGQAECADCQAALLRDRTADKLAAVQRDGPSCSWCGEPLPDDLGAAELDHIIPVSRGGPRDALWNKQVLHKPCNKAKHHSVTPRALAVAAEHGYELARGNGRQVFRLAAALSEPSGG